VVAIAGYISIFLPVLQQGSFSLLITGREDAENCAEEAQESTGLASPWGTVDEGDSMVFETGEYGGILGAIERCLQLG
jgi:hypothetical protein